VEKQFFNKGLISGLILLEQGEEQDFFRKKCSEFFTRAFFLTKENAKKKLATMVNRRNITWVQNNLENSCHNSEPSH